MSSNKQIKVTLLRSLAKRLPNHVACAHGLGLRRPNSTKTLTASPEVMGMVAKISYLLKVEEI